MTLSVQKQWASICVIVSSAQVNERNPDPEVNLLFYLRNKTVHGCVLGKQRNKKLWKLCKLLLHL